MLSSTPTRAVLRLHLTAEWQRYKATVSTICHMPLAGHDFEDEVRRVARELWPSAQYAGASMEAGRERDGVFHTEWVTHLLEATTWRTKEKAKHDIEKLCKLRRQLSSRGKPLQCWFVTQDEPTADQRSVAPKDGSVNVLSFEQFRSKLVDSHSYIRSRKKYAFGSARDPASGLIDVREKYIPLSLVGPSGPVTVDDVVVELISGSRAVILGDYGAGKSMTMRAVFDGLSDRFRRLDTTAFPIHINLRDHHAQSDPAEALTRHALSIGFRDASQLVRAWRAGYAHLLLDGFDEMATPGWIGPTSRMRDIRRRSVELVRRFVKETPVGVGLVLAGREHYFDSRTEMIATLAAGPPFSSYTLMELSDDQIESYLKQHGWTGGLPEWLPARPLLLSYLANRGLLKEALAVPAGSSPAMAWDSLLGLICDREAELESGVDGATVRRLVERLASIARSRGDGLGPLEFSEIESAFRAGCGYSPDDRAMVLLQRLPGLGPTDPETGTRRFMDSNLADAARAGDVSAYTKNMFVEELPESAHWTTGLGVLGVEISAYQLTQNGVPVSKVAAAVRHTSTIAGKPYLLSDLVRILAEIDGRLCGVGRFYIAEVWIDELSLTNPDMNLADVSFRGCVFEELDAPREGTGPQGMPQFVSCHFGRINGRSSFRDLSPDRFVDCTCDDFTESGVTTASLLATSLPVGQRVALTVLKKLYMQRGSGRKESALLRGLDQKHQTVVPSVLALLQRQRLAVEGRSGKERIWVPARRATPRVREMIDGPTTCTDPAWQELAKLD
jgi:hypothetical protein